MNDRTPEPDDLLSAYLDGEATADEAEAVVRRLADSGEARSELEDYRAISELLRGLPSAQAPDGLRAAVMRRIERETLLPPAAAATTPMSRRRRWLLGAGVGTAGLVSAGLLAAFLADREGELPHEVAETSAPQGDESEAIEKAAASDDHFVARRNEVAIRRPSEAVAAAKPSVQRPVLAERPIDRAALAATVDRTKAAAAGSMTGPAKLAADDPNPLSGYSYRAADAENGPAVGDVFSYLERNGDSVVVVEATVVDVRRALDTLQVLFARNAVPSVAVGEVEATGGDGLGRFMEKSAMQPGRELGVYVEADEAQVAAALGDFGRERTTLALAPAGTLRQEAQPFGAAAYGTGGVARRGLGMAAPALRDGTADKQNGRSAETAADAAPKAEAPEAPTPASRMATVPAPSPHMARFAVPADGVRLKAASTAESAAGAAADETRPAAPAAEPMAAATTPGGPAYQRVIDVPPVVLEQLRNQGVLADTPVVERKQDVQLLRSRQYAAGRRVRLLVVLDGRSPVEAPKPPR